MVLYKQLGGSSLGKAISPTLSIPQLYSAFKEQFWAGEMDPWLKQLQLKQEATESSTYM